MCAECMNRTQFPGLPESARARGKHEYTGSTKAAPVVTSGRITGSAEVQPSREGPVRPRRQPKHGEN